MSCTHRLPRRPLLTWLHDCKQSGAVLAGTLTLGALLLILIMGTMAAWALAEYRFNTGTDDAREQAEAARAARP